MDTKERYGRFVLQFEDARTSAGSFYRAVQLGAAGFERHVQLFRSERLGPDALQAVADGLKKGLAVQHAQVVRGFEAGSADRAAFGAYEMVEGRSVGALMERSQSEGHPFAVDHALLIASKAAAALEAAQSRKQTHGFLVPEFVQVSHDGEVSVRAFGLPPRVLRESNCVGIREAAFLAPEVAGSSPLDIRADVYSLGAQLLGMLTGLTLSDGASSVSALQGARMHSPGGDGSPIPKALAALLGQALSEDPSARFKDATAFKKAVDTLLFSGDYSPTTFNLAFFMHTLFRDEGDEDAARLKAERSADYRPYLTASAAATAAAGPIAASEVRSAPAPSPQSPVTPRAEAPARPDPVRAETPRADTARGTRVPPVPPVPSASDEPLFQTVMAEKKSFPVAPVAIGVVVAIAIAGYFFTRSGSAPAAPATSPTMNAAETAALARVRELESRLAALEAEKVAAETKAADDARKMIEAQAKARGRAVDPAELQKAQDEARKKAQADQEARLSGERQKIEDERKRAEETRAAEAAKTPEGTPTAAPPSAPTTTPAPAAASTTGTPAPAPPDAAAPSAAPPSTPQTAPAGAGASTLLDISDPGVVAPQLVTQPRVDYPPMARAQRITGTVVISALVDEQGNVAEARVIRGAIAANSGLNQAALDSVKRRRYRPAMFNGKPGRAWIAIQIEFKL